MEAPKKYYTYKTRHNEVLNTKIYHKERREVLHPWITKLLIQITGYLIAQHFCQNKALFCHATHQYARLATNRLYFRGSSRILKLQSEMYFGIFESVNIVLAKINHARKCFPAL